MDSMANGKRLIGAWVNGHGFVILVWAYDDGTTASQTLRGLV